MGIRWRGLAILGQMLLGFSSYAQEGKVECWQIPLRFEKEEIYYIPKAADAGSVDGLLYDYATKSCFSIQEKRDKSGINCVQSPSPCSPEMESEAKVLYHKEGNFKKFLERFRSCLKKHDRACLRTMISKRVDTNFAKAGTGDAAHALLKAQTDKQLDEMLFMVNKAPFGRQSAVDSREFAKVNDETAIRGVFRLVDGSWRLTRYRLFD